MDRIMEQQLETLAYAAEAGDETLYRAVAANVHWTQVPQEQLEQAVGAAHTLGIDSLHKSLKSMGQTRYPKGKWDAPKGAKKEAAPKESKGRGAKA